MIGREGRWCLGGGELNGSSREDGECDGGLGFSNSINKYKYCNAIEWFAGKLN